MQDPAYRIVSGRTEWADAATQGDAYFCARTLSEETPGREFTVLDRGEKPVGWARDGRLTIPQGAQR